MSAQTHNEQCTRDAHYEERICCECTVTNARNSLYWSEEKAKGAGQKSTRTMTNAAAIPTMRNAKRMTNAYECRGKPAMRNAHAIPTMRNARKPLQTRIEEYMRDTHNEESMVIKMMTNAYECQSRPTMRNACVISTTRNAKMLRMHNDERVV